jgi:hypothetical protein
MHDLTRLALVGTANAPTDAATCAAIDGLLPAGRREQRLLWQAGSQAVYRAAGRLPAPLALPAAALIDPWPVLPTPLHRWCTAKWVNELEDLGPWMVQRMQQCAFRLPEALLPDLLAQPRIRALWWPVMGERGRWLAAQHADWSPLLALQNPSPDDEGERLRLWEEGDFAARCEALRQQRRTDPALGRDWLAGALPQEKADQRLALVQTLDEGLGADDEPLLERLLGDRSQAVRQAAVGLLARLPASACAARLAARADGCLQWQASGAPQGMVARLSSWLGQGGAPALQVTLPAEIDKQWERDGILATPPAGEGPRAFWLRQVLAWVPPERWTQQTGHTPAVLLGVIRTHEWADPLLLGLVSATCHFGDADWAAVLLELALSGQAKVLNPRTHATVQTLWSVLTPAARQEALLRLLQAGRLEAVQQGLQHTPAPWSAELTDAVSRTAGAADAGPGPAVKPGADHRVPDLLGPRVELLALAALRASDAGLPGVQKALHQCAEVATTATASAEMAQRTGLWDWQARQYLKKIDQVQTQIRAKLQFIKEMPL